MCVCACACALVDVCTGYFHFCHSVPAALATPELEGSFDDLIVVDDDVSKVDVQERDVKPMPYW